MKSYLVGRVAANSEIDFISEHFVGFSCLEEYIQIIKNYRIIGQYFTLSSKDDYSGTGVEMEWMNPKEQVEEAFEYFPGIIVSKNDFMPIGMCLTGSGDPYFLKADNKGNWNVFRVLHDVALDGKFRDDMVELVIPFDKLFSMIDKMQAGLLENAVNRFLIS